MIEDFFRLSVDVLLYYYLQAIPSPLMESILSAACSSLTLLKEEPLIATLHFLRDFLGYGEEYAPSSNFDQTRHGVPPEIQARVKQLVAGQGDQLVQRIMTGMMYTFPRDCFPDASGVLLSMFQLMPEQVAVWVQGTVNLLPPGSITQQETDRLLTNIKQ